MFPVSEAYGRYNELYKMPYHRKITAPFIPTKLVKWATLTVITQKIHSYGKKYIFSAYTRKATPLPFYIVFFMHNTYFQMF